MLGSGGDACLSQTTHHRSGAHAVSSTARGVLSARHGGGGVNEDVATGDGGPGDPAETYFQYSNLGLTLAGEVAIVRWEDGLASLSVPTTDPVRAITKLRKTGEHTFRRVRKDEALGEELVFEVGPDGKATRITWHGNHYRRVR
jgi:hypothetical protein